MRVNIARYNVRSVLTIFVVIISGITANAQKENNNWCFGKYCGISFNTNPPVAFYGTKVGTQQHSASVSNRHTGVLLFYTDGNSVWDAQNNPMPGGDIGKNLVTNGSNRNSLAIIPDLADTNRYYIFHTGRIDIAIHSLFYSVVDMRLNGGKGDVVGNLKQVKMGDEYRGMTVARGYNCDMWLIVTTMKRDGLFSSEFHAFNITKAGVDNTPVISPLGNWKGLFCLQASPDSRRIATSRHGSNEPGGMWLYDFNAFTGVVSNQRDVFTYLGYSSYASNAEFSPDGKRLYLGYHHSNSSGGDIYQYDVTQPTTAGIVASKKTIASNASSTTDYRISPNGEIWLVNSGTQKIAKIVNPNALYPGCQYVPDPILFSENAEAEVCLPLQVLYAGLVRVSEPSDKIYSCFGNGVVLSGRPGSKQYLWNDNSTSATLTATQPGTYWVESISDCLAMTDTFEVENIDFAINLGSDTTICKNDYITLKANVPNATLLWQDGSGGNSFSTNTAGIYSVTVNVQGCIKADTIFVSVKDSVNFSLGPDTSLCPDAKYTITVPSHFDSYEWSTGAKGYMETITKKGTYWLRCENDGCKHADTLNVDYHYPYFNLGNDTLLCVDEKLTLIPLSMAGSRYTWQDGSMGEQYIVDLPGKYWAVAENICGVYSDTVQVDFEHCVCSPFIPTAFTPNKDGLNDAFGPILDCDVSGYKFLVVNRFGEVIYNSTTPGEKWDGNYKATSCDLGTYYYMLKLTGPEQKEYLFKGDVVLMR